MDGFYNDNGTLKRATLVYNNAGTINSNLNIVGNNSGTLNQVVQKDKILLNLTSQSFLLNTTKSASVGINSDKELNIYNSNIKLELFGKYSTLASTGTELIINNTFKQNNSLKPFWGLGRTGNFIKITKQDGSAFDLTNGFTIAIDFDFNSGASYCNIWELCDSYSDTTLVPRLYTGTNNTLISGYGNNVASKNSNLITTLGTMTKNDFGTLVYVYDYRNKKFINYFITNDSSTTDRTINQKTIIINTNMAKSKKELRINHIPQSTSASADSANLNIYRLCAWETALTADEAKSLL